MEKQIKQFKKELEMAINNFYVLHDCGASQQELEKQNQKIALLKAIIDNMKAYAEIREEPKSEDKFWEEFEEELEYEEKVLKEL